MYVRTSDKYDYTLTVLGGSSVSTPALIGALCNAVVDGQLPPLNLNLFGRNRLQMDRILDYSSSRYPCQRHLRISIHNTVESAARGATHILCQVRPGGMSARASDEQLAIKHRSPADEGIGVGGLAAFVRGRQIVRELVQRCAHVAPNAVFLQMTGPLGLMVAIAREGYPHSSYGVCELPQTTRNAVYSYLRSHSEYSGVRHFHCGVNHCSWLYAFRDEDGRDIDLDVVELIATSGILGFNRSDLIRYGAIPVSYLRLFFDTEEIVDKQSKRISTRGEILEKWGNALNQAYLSAGANWAPSIESLLSQRNTNWYADGIVPALKAFLSDNVTNLTLNLPSAGAIADVSHKAIVEVSCIVSQGLAKPMELPALPALPMKLTRQLIDFEQAALAIPSIPTKDSICEALSLHPLVRKEFTGSIATDILGEHSRYRALE